jgi:hypothetical protein
MPVWTSTTALRGAAGLCLLSVFFPHHVTKFCPHSWNIAHSRSRTPPHEASRGLEINVRHGVAPPQTSHGRKNGKAHDQGTAQRSTGGRHARSYGRQVRTDTPRLVSAGRGILDPEIVYNAVASIPVAEALGYTNHLNYVSLDPPLIETFAIISRDPASLSQATQATQAREEHMRMLPAVPADVDPAGLGIDCNDAPRGRIAAWTTSKGLPCTLFVARQLC